MDNILRREHIYEIRGNAIEHLCSFTDNPENIVQSALWLIETLRNIGAKPPMISTTVKKQNMVTPYIVVISDENLNDTVKEFCTSTNLNATVKIRTTTVSEKCEELA